MLLDQPSLLMQHKLQYILHHFKKVYRIDEIPVGISYGTDENSKICILQGDTSPLIKCEKYVPENHQIVWKLWKGTNIPFFFGTEHGELINFIDNQYVISQDIIASAFYLLSG